MPYITHELEENLRYYSRDPLHVTTLMVPLENVRYTQTVRDALHQVCAVKYYIQMV